jgi:hypothetical protein
MAGSDRIIGTRDDRRLGISSVTYNAATRTVTVRPNGRIPLRVPAQLTVRSSGPNGLTDRSGTLLDGDRDGRPGGDFVATFQGVGVAMMGANGTVTTANSSGGTRNANRLLPLKFRLSPAAVDTILGQGTRVSRRRVRTRPQA